MTTLIRPLRALRPAPEYAPDVAAPPYDVLTSAEARNRAADRPYSFLHISKPEIDLAEGVNPYSPDVYAKGAENLHKLVNDGVLIRDDQDFYYVYRLRMGDHVQTGLVCAGSIDEYDKNRIRKHEFTRPKKEDDRVRQITALNAQTGPVLLAYRNTTPVKTIIDQAVTAIPLYDLTADGGIQHTVWRITEAPDIAMLTANFDAMNALYIADGHHRSAAASRVAAARKAANPQHSGEEAYNYFLCVAFPHDETQILDYNRVVKDLNRNSPCDLLADIEKSFDVSRTDTPAKPTRSAQFGMYLDGQWYRLEVHANLIPDDPVASLDVSLLQEQLISPLLDIEDPRTDERIDFVGGIRGMAELERRVDSGEMAAAFALFPTSMDALIAVADANEVMPPKSTWFEPKLADGLISHVLD